MELCKLLIPNYDGDVKNSAWSIFSTLLHFTSMTVFAFTPPCEINRPVRGDSIYR